MKLLLPTAAFLLLVLASCKKENTSGNTVTGNATTADTINTQLKSVARAMDGLWISDNYLSGIEKTKSIYSNKEYGTVNRLFGFTLYKDSLSTGTTELLGFTEHEGGIVYPLLYNEANKQFVYDPKRAHELDGPTQLSLYPAEGGLIEIAYTQPKSQKDRFRKIGDSKSDIDLLDETLNQMLFEGNYTDGAGNTVSFTRTGKVSGIKGIDHYYLLYDFGEGLEFDTVFLWQGESNGDRVTYHFKIDGKTIKLYATGLNEEKMEYAISKEPVFVLIRG
mgnify:CR=1 FL=1